MGSTPRRHVEAVGKKNGSGESMRFSLTIFDYDGVLNDSLQHAVSVGRAFCRSISHNRLPTAQTIASLRTMTYTELALSVGLTANQAEMYARYTFERFQAMAPSMAFFPEIEPLLHRLASTPVAIVSGNARRVIAAKLAAHGLADKITCIFGALEPGDKAKKMHQACAYFGVDPGKACMIGDSTSDIRYAKLAGVASIAVTWGWQSRARLVSENPDYIVDSVQALSTLLHSTGGERGDDYK